MPALSNRSGRVALVAVLVAAALLRLAHWWAVRDAPFIAQLAMDSAEYDRWAREIAAGDWLGNSPFFQAPLYPYLLAVVYRLVGAHLDVIYLAQIALALAGLALVARTGDRVLGRPHGGAAAALGAIYLPAVFHEIQLAKEGPALFLVALLLDRLTAAREGSRPEATADADRARAAHSASPEGRIPKEEGAPRTEAPSRPQEPLPPSGQGQAETPVLCGLAATFGPRWSTWLTAGLALGLLSLLRENALLLIPFLVPLAIQRAAPRNVIAKRAALFLVGVALPLLPVAARNAAVGGGFLPTTFQGGVNLWIGNNPEADGTYHPVVPGKQVPALERAEARRLAEQATGRELTGAEVSRYWLGRVFDWVRREPTAFARLQLRKLALYFAPYEWPDAVDYAWMKTISRPLRVPGLEWGGLVALAAWGVAFGRNRRRTLAPLLLFELGWLVATVVFYLFSRYRLPAAPGLYILASLPVVATGEAWVRAGRRGRGAPLLRSGLLLAALLVPWLVAPQSRLDLVEFNLGRLAEQHGASETARIHYEAALAANPSFFLAAMNLGSLAARSGHLAEGIDLLERAVAIEPRSDNAWANLGAARLAAGDLDGARSALERALELNARHEAANRNLELLRRRKDGAP